MLFFAPLLLAPLASSMIIPRNCGASSASAAPASVSSVVSTQVALAVSSSAVVSSTKSSTKTSATAKASSTAKASTTAKASSTAKVSSTAKASTTAKASSTKAAASASATKAAVTSSSNSTVAATSAVASASAASSTAASASSECTITSLDDVDSVVSSCTSIAIASFTVDADTTLDLSGLSDGSTVTLAGDITWAKSTDFEGPLFLIDGSDITFDGAGFTFDGNGAEYWDGQGSNGGVTKPKFLKVNMGGTFSGLNVLNAPVHVFSIGSSEALTISEVVIDNTAGDELDSDGDKLGHNSDCFDVSATDLTITNSKCYNQDDCLAINKGSNIAFTNNFCSGGHGISIGSIASDKVVDTVTISGNTVEKSTNGLRIKTIYEATGGSVTGITYTDNTVSASDYGVIIEQDYENGSPTGTPTNGITIDTVTFSGSNTVTMTEDDGLEVYVLCGDGSCTGTWDWTGLSVSGGEAGSITGDPPITGFTISA